MEKLPLELKVEVAAYLCPTDLKSLRLVNKQYAGIAAGPLFALLRFSGNQQDDRLEMKPGVYPFEYWKHVGRKKTVEYGKMRETAAEMLDWGHAHLVKTMSFDPAYYRPGFWQDYRAQVEEDMDEPISERELHYEDDDDDDDDGSEEYNYEAAWDRAVQERAARPEREAPLIEAAERVWEGKVAEQTANESAITTALTRLFEKMGSLRTVEISSWELGDFMGLKFSRADIDYRRPTVSIATQLLMGIARALHGADRHIKELCVNDFVPGALSDTPALRLVFTGLQHLRISMTFVDFLLEDSQGAPIFTEMMRIAAPTLESLEIKGGGSHPQLPARGVHSLLKVLCNADDDGSSPLVFPELKFVHVGSLIHSTEALSKFLAAQPKLEKLNFSFLYLASDNAHGWPYLAGNLPATVHNWTISGRAGHKPCPGFTPPIAYNWMQEWKLWMEPIPETTGWKMGKSENNVYLFIRR